MAEISLRPYQEEAMQAFFANHEVGLFEMATGTGKTFTSLACAAKDFKENGRQFLVIIVPYLHLIDQWKKDLPLFNIKGVITVARSKNQWFPMLKNAIWNYQHHFLDRVVVIGSYDSLSKPECRELFQNLDHSFLLADECHNIGKKSYKNHPLIHFEKRLGISATPERWQDERGTDQVYEFFGKTVYRFTMEEAIQQNFLTPYDYFPVLVGLTENEQENFEILSKKITNLMHQKEDYRELLEKLLLKRSRILKRAEEKFDLLYDLISEQEDKRYTLIYCAEGDIDKVIQTLAPLHLKIHRFNSEMNQTERQKVLQEFAEGSIEVLVAIKCLDEGVDVPATKTAYFLASTSNPREFIQRRGRVLRKSPGKEKAIIYDFIVLPEIEDQAIFEKIARKEIPRCVEFTNYARNRYIARKPLYEVLDQHKLSFYLELDSKKMKEYLEEQYQEMIEEEW